MTAPEQRTTAHGFADQLIADAVERQASMIRHRSIAAADLAVRNTRIRQLRDLNRKRWTYEAIGQAVGLSTANVVKILRKNR